MPTERRLRDRIPEAAGIYGRLSDDRAGKGLAIVRQTDDSEELAQTKKWGVKGHYADNDISAYSGKVRKDYRRLLADIQSGAIDGVIAWHPDRLHRSPTELEEFIDIVERAGIPVITVQGGEYDLSTASGRMTARVVGAVARHESEHKSERLRRKHEELAKGGHRSGGGKDRGFGYERDRMTMRADEAKLIRDGARRALAGESLRSIARRWNETKVLTTNGQPWYTSAVRKVLNSARIAGLREYEGELYKAVWPAIISRAEWERLRAILRDPLRRTNRVARRYLLSGLAVCGKCGVKLVARPRAAECVKYVEHRLELAATRAKLATVREAVREQRAKLLHKVYSAANLRELDRLRKTESDLRDRVELLASEKAHVVVGLRATLRAGREERACATCSSAVESVPTYVCPSGDEGGCGKLRRLAEPVEELVQQVVSFRVDGPELQKAIKDQERKAAKTTPAMGNVTALEKQLEDLARDMANKRITRREWLAARDELQAQLDALQASFRREQRTTALTPYLGGQGTLTKRWPSLSIDERRAILRAVLDKVVFKPAVPGLNRFDPKLIEPIWRV